MASGIASAGVVVGLSFVGASAASAVTPADCDASLDSGNGDTVVQLQTLLTASTGTICLTGTFTLTGTPLTPSAAVTLLGVGDAELVGDGTTGIISSGFDVTVQDLTFMNGHAQGNGGAIYVSAGGGTVTATGSTFLNNVAEDDGGAIAANNVIVDSSTFSNNFAGLDEGGFGGAIYGYQSVEATASTFVENGADAGGAVYSYGNADVTNSTFVSNTATGDGDGGGAIVQYSGLVLQSTFLNNEATGDNPAGQSLEVIDAFGSGNSVTLIGNIFANDQAAAHIGSTQPTLTATDGGGNVFSTPAVTETQLDSVQPSTLFDTASSALFATSTLGDNGGPTQTVALSATSPAINRVPVTDPTVAVDQRGVTRTQNDSGASEYVAPPALAATGLVPNGLLGGVAALVLAAGVAAVGFGRRFARR